MKNPPIKLKTETGEAFEVPEDGSLGLLALGYVGVMLWREKRREMEEKRAASLRSNYDFLVRGSLKNRSSSGAENGRATHPVLIFYNSFRA